MPASKQKQPRISEHAIQSMCVEWFRLQYPGLIIAAIPNGIRASFSQARKAKREGVLAGFPDLFIPKPTRLFHGLFVEMKAKGGSVKDHQAKVLSQLNDEGYCVCVCKSFEEFRETVSDYFREAA